MRELVFAVEYGPGADPVMDVFREHEVLRSRSIACHVSSEGIWRIDRFNGPTDALETIDGVYADHDRCLDCLTGVHDRQSTIHETLDASSGSRTVYTYRDVTTDCYSIPCLTCKHVTKGVLSESERHGDTEEWRLLLRDDGGVGDLYADLEASLRPGLSVEFAQIVEPTYWTEKAVTVAELPAEQRTAVEHGYYETPRESRCRTSPRNSTCRGQRSSIAFSRPSPGSSNGSSATRRWVTSPYRSGNETPEPSPLDCRRTQTAAEDR